VRVREKKRERGGGIRDITAKDALVTMSHKHVMWHNYKSRDRIGNQNYKI